MSGVCKSSDGLPLEGYEEASTSASLGASAPENTGAPSKDPKNVQLVVAQNALIEELVKEKDEFLQPLSGKVACLCLCINKKLEVLLEKRYIAKQILMIKETRDCEFHKKPLCKEEIYLDTLNISVDAISSYLDSLKDSFNKKTRCIEQQCGRQAKNIRAHVAKMSREDNDVLTDIMKNTSDYFLVYFSVMPILNEEQEIEKLHLGVERKMAETSMRDCIKEEDKIWRRFINGRLHLLERYRKRYLVTSLSLLKKAMAQKCKTYTCFGLHYPYNEEHEIWSRFMDSKLGLRANKEKPKKCSGDLQSYIRNLERLAERDRYRIVTAWEECSKNIETINKCNNTHLLDYIREFKMGKDDLDLYELDVHAYDYLVNLSSVIKNRSEVTPLSNTSIATNSMENFVTRELARIRKDIPSTIRRYNSEGDLFSLSKRDKDKIFFEC